MRHLDFIISLFVGTFATIMIIMVMGEALTGGLRLSSSPGPVEPVPAALFFLWLCGVIYLSAKAMTRAVLETPRP